MYRKNNKIIQMKENLGNYIEDFDVYNSLLLLRMSDTYIEREIYQINTYEFRPDLVAKDYYGSEDYMAYVILQAGLSLSGYVKGRYIQLIPTTQTIMNDIVLSLYLLENWIQIASAPTGEANRELLLTMYLNIKKQLNIYT